MGILLIAAATGIFSLMNTGFLKPLAHPDPGRLVQFAV
jgi:hypothetical protein